MKKIMSLLIMVLALVSCNKQEVFESNNTLVIYINGKSLTRTALDKDPKNVENNVNNAKKYSRYTMDNHAIPVTPHLLYPQFMDDTNELERELAMHFNYVLLGKCTELWVFGGIVSRGMAREIGLARKRRMKIKWFDHAMMEVDAYA